MPILVAAVVIGAILWALQAARSSAPAPTPAQNAQTMNQLLLSMQDPNWQQKVQTSLMNDNDALGLDIQAATIGVAEPFAAQALRIKVAALQGKAAYSPPALPAAVDDPNVFDLFATGQYQGCDASSACDPTQAKYGSGPGFLGLDAGLAQLDPDAQDCVSYLLQAYPDSFAREFPKSAVIHGDPTGTLAQAINAVENVVRGALPMLATSLRYKAKFLTTNHDALNTQALAALSSGTPMTSAGGPVTLHGPSFGPPLPPTQPSGATLHGPQNWLPPVHAPLPPVYIPQPTPTPVQSWFSPVPAPIHPQNYIPLQPPGAQPTPPPGPGMQPPNAGPAGTSAITGFRDHTAWVQMHSGAAAFVHVKPRWIGARMHVLGVVPAQARRAPTRKHINLR